MRQVIMQEIIRSGGLFAQIAKLYVDDENKSDLFITECFDHCDNQKILGQWGSKLIKDIVNYRKTLCELQNK